MEIFLTFKIQEEELPLRISSIVIFFSLPAIVLTFVEVFSVVMFELSSVLTIVFYQSVCLSSDVVQFDHEKLCASFCMMTLMYPGR